MAEPFCLAAWRTKSDRRLGASQPATHCDEAEECAAEHRDRRAGVGHRCAIGPQPRNLGCYGKSTCSRVGYDADSRPHGTLPRATTRQRTSRLSSGETVERLALPSRLRFGSDAGAALRRDSGKRSRRKAAPTVCLQCPAACREEFLLEARNWRSAHTRRNAF